MRFCGGVGNLGLSLYSLLLFVIGNHDTLFLNLDGKPCMTTFGAKSHGYYENGKSHLLVRSFKTLFPFDWQLLFHLCDHSFAVCFAVFEHPNLESRYQGRVQAALEFACEIDDFDDLVDPCCLYNHFLGPKPLEYVLRKILWKEKSMCISLFPFCFFFFGTYLFLWSFFARMATRYSKDKHARVKGMKNEPLSQLAIDTKKCKLIEEKSETIISSSIHIVPSSPTSCFEMVTVTPPTTHSKGKSKIGKSIWEDLATDLGRVHNIIMDEELKGLASIPSHELVSRHIHKLVQVFYTIVILSLNFLPWP